jgi:hypothetical protein
MLSAKCSDSSGRAVPHSATKVSAARLTRIETSYGVVLDVETVKLHSVL